MAKRLLWLLAAFMVLGGVLAFLSMQEDEPEVAEDETQEESRPLVSVVPANITRHQGYVSVFAEVDPRWSIDLKARVSGTVRSVSMQALAGKRVTKGTQMVRLEQAPYNAELANAQYELANAEFTLRQKRNKSRIAENDWRASRPNENPPEMAIHLPEVQVAESAVEAAKRRVASAQYDVDSTTITAPFDGIITSRSVSIGQSVSAGDTLFTLLDDSQLDIHVSLDARQWALLDKRWSDSRARILDESGAFIGTATVQSGGGFLDRESRRYQLFLEVDGTENQGALPGQFVTVALPGQAVDNTLEIPESALTPNGFVWYADENDLLRRFEARALFRNDGHVVVRPPENLVEEGSLRVLVMPMAAYLPGQKVKPVLEER
ncbi:efflux RND transporter periplasmic adaptor subunit [Pseudovibrio exalbescens]|uniref:efflux RND transporter periplasmic adaptor subunit n=1 Tax=Pseudovibrio exalbescens TaxID=197461 RepID=UPI002365A9A3|nr:efflux RND transporter periplasmic adaptor subunit [Pseudovibrio exalbescens]MDD7910829.1 efflux RND transporter periplasmic adaptor subunit [Pseudovibrio exalbescens]